MPIVFGGVPALPLVIVVVSIMSLALPGAGLAHQESDVPDRAAIRAATAPYRDVAAAEAAGYGWLPGRDGAACIEDQGTGGQGVRYVNAVLVIEGALQLRRPQALLYAPDADGGLRLVAVEYFVLQRDWDRRSPDPPVLFGQELALVPGGSRSGLPAAYLLRVWVWRDNPLGMFADWHPDISCPWWFHPARTEPPDHHAYALPRV